MKRLFDRIASFLTQSPSRFFFVAAVVAFFILWFVNAYRDPNGFSWHDVIVESHGVLFDLLVFGILLSLYETLREKQRLLEEIHDYRGWDEKEAMYRITGAIRRLNKLKVSKIDLGNCYLRGADLRGVDLRGANLPRADLEGADLSLIESNPPKFFYDAQKFRFKIMGKSSNLQNANLQNANLQNVIFTDANLQGADLTYANLQGADLSYANLQEGNLQEANLQEANLQEANLQEATVPHDWFQSLEIWQVTGRLAIIEKYYIDENNRLQLKQPPQA